MKAFSLLLLLVVSGILFEILCRPFGRLVALYRGLLGAPSRFALIRRHTLPASGPVGSLRRSPADEVWRPAAQF